jgi:hypothetical protein
VASAVAAFAAGSAFAQDAAPAAGGGRTRERTVPVIESGKWTGKRLADGQPDVQGHWSNTIGNHNNLTDPQGPLAGDNQRGNRLPRSERAPSRVSDPPDGQVPFQPWARVVQQDFLANLNNPTRPEYVEPLARCYPGGVPKSFMWHGFEIRQYPGRVLIMFDSGWRMIYLDGRPHLPENVKLWNADSRGHWEGNTLVVDVTNNNAKARFGRSGEFASDQVHVDERYVFDNAGQRFNYAATFTDPTVYTRPWTVTIPVKRYTERDTADGWNYEGAPANTKDGHLVHERIERMCIENNGPFGQVSVAAPSK